MSEVDFTIEAQAEGGYWSILKASYSKDRFGTEVPLDVHLHTEKLDYSRILKFNFKFPKWMDYRQLTAIGLIKIAHKLLSSWLRQSCSHDEVRLGLITDSVRGYFKNLWTHIIRNKDRFATFTDDFKSPIDKHKSQFKIFDLEFSILLLATLRLSLQRQKSHLISSSLIEKELILKEKVEYWREAYARRGLTEPGDAKEIACMEVLAESDYAWTQHHSQAKVYEMVESDLDSILKNTSFDKGGDYFKAEVVKRVEMLKEQAAARNESPRQLLIELFNHSQMATGFVASKWTSNTQTGVERAMAYFAELVRGLLDSSSNLIVDLVAIANSIAEGQKNSLDILSKLLDDSVDFCIQKDGYLHDLGEITVQLKRRPEALKVLNVQILNRFFVKGQLKTFKSLVRHADWLDLNEPQKIEYVKDLLEGVLMESELELATHRDLLVEASENNYPVHYYYIQNAVVQKYKNYSDKSQLIEYVAMVQNERYGKGKEFSDEYTKLLFDIVFENGTSFTYADLRNLLSNFEHVWKRFLSLVMKGCDSKALILENLLSYSKSPNDHLKNYPYFSHGLSLLASMDKPQTDWQDASTFLLAFLDILSKLHVPQKLLRELQLDYHSRKVAFSCAERAKNFINIVAQFTAPSKEAMNDHQETVKDLVQKCLLSFEEYQKRAKMYQEKVRLPCYDCLSVVVNTQRFNKIVDALGNDKSVTTDFSVLVRDFEAELDVDSKDIDIFLESHDDNVLVSKLCLCLTKRIEAGKPENLKEYLANLAGSAIDGLVSELEQQLNVSYILSMDVPKLDLSYGDAARLFKTSVSLFEELVVKMAFEPSANLNMIASNLLKLGSFSMKNALNSSYKYFKNPRTLESLAFLRKDRYQQLECLKNMAWLTNSTLIQSLISFIETYKRAAIKGKEAAVKDMEASVVDKEPNLQDKKPENILDLLSILLKNKEEKLLLADYDKELTAIILPVLVEHDKAKEYLKEISEDTYGLLEQVKTLSEDQINEMTLGQAELKQYSLKQEDVLILKGIRSAIENSKTWEEVIRNLHQQCSKEAEGCFKNLELIKNPESVSKFLKDYMSNLLTSEERKRSNILRILEGAIFCYYRDHDADCYSLYVFIKSEEPERQFDMKDPLEMNLQKDWRVMLEESKTKQANVVTQEEFISMKAITDFMLKYDAGQAKLRKFNGTARSAISILEMINQLEKDCHVTNLQTAIQAIYKELEIQLKLNLIDNRFNSISFEINLKEETSSPELEGLNEIIKFLVSRCKEAKEKVFSSMVHQYYPWSCFQPFQLKLLDTYLQKASKKGEKIELTDIADKTRLLIDYVDAPFSLDSSAANLNMVKPNIGITYSLLDTFSKIFEVDHDSKPKAPSNLQRTGKARFRRIQFDQSNRMKTLIEVFSKDHNRQQNRISESAFTHHHEQKQRKTRALFCSSFTKWSEIEIFILRSVRDQEENSYIIIDAHLLDVDLRFKLLSELKNCLEERETFINLDIKLLVPLKDSSRIDDEITHRYKQSFTIEDLAFKKNWTDTADNVLLVKSEYAGLGKTYFIEKDARVNNYGLLVLNLTGKITPDVLKKRLIPIGKRLSQEGRDNRLALRIKIDITETVQDTFHYLDQLLFKICILKVIEFGPSYLGFQKIQKFYIEVQNTLDKRLLKVDFVHFLIESGCEVTMMPPLQTKKITESRDDDYQDDENNVNFEETTGHNRLDLSELLKIGLLDSMLLHFLSTEPLIEDLGRFGLSQDETLIQYINPCQIIRPILKSIYKKKLNANPEPKYLNEIPKLFTNQGKLNRAEKECVQQEEAERARLDEIRKRIRQQMPSTYGYTIWYLLIKYIFQINELPLEARNIEVLKNTSKDDLWLILLFDAEENFEYMYGRRFSSIHDSGGYCDQPLQGTCLDLIVHADDSKAEKERKKRVKLNILKCIDTLLGRIGDFDYESTSTSKNLMYHDINFYHIKTLLKLSKQFVDQLNQTDSLDMEAMINPAFNLKAKYDVSGTTVFRKDLVGKSMEQSRNLAFKQIISVSKLQSQSHAKEGTEYEKVLNEMKLEAKISYHWFFLHQGVVKLIHNDESLLGKDGTYFYGHQLLKPQNLSAEKSQSEYIQEICESVGANKSENEILSMTARIEQSIMHKNKRFMITADNYLKIRLILQRAEVGIPIILLGESGCGKTFMIEFISEQLLIEEDLEEEMDEKGRAKKTQVRQLKMMTFHSGVTEGELSKLIIDCIALAEKDTTKKVWLFLDEINTTPLLPNIAELITERRAHFLDSTKKNLPENIIIVAACNPYQIETKKKRFTSSKSSETQLVHKVYPLPENLISYCFNYGQLTEKDEKSMIKTILEDSKIDEIKNHLVELTDCLSLGQNLIRKFENDSSASLRDVRRYINLLRTLIKRDIWVLADCIKLAFYCCYSIRIQPYEQEERQRNVKEGVIGPLATFNSIVEDCINRFKEAGQKLSIEALFTQESSKLLEAAKKIEEREMGQQAKDTKKGSCFQGIAINRPLMENVFILLHSFLSGIPVYICGRPGTSKSVSIQVVEAIFNFKKEEKDKSTYFKNLPPAKFYPLWGSQDTTAKQVEEEFNRVREIARRAAKGNDGSQNMLRIIYFEEMGVADSNQNNPLKVLHPLLEPREKDAISQMGFVGLSNTLLDAAKLNRLLNVPRFDMDDSELTATIKHYKIDETLRTMTGNNPSDAKILTDWTICPFSEALVNSYRRFREQEQESKFHSDFHGPRDFYTMCKWIGSNLPVLSEYYQNNNANSSELFHMMLSFFVLAIERSFSGRELEIKAGHDGIKNTNASVIFKEIFFKLLVSEKELKKIDKSWRTVKSTTSRMISMNLCDQNARHLMIFIEGPFYVDTVVDAIREYQIAKGVKEDKIKFLNKAKQSITSLINDFNSYISDGYTVIMRDMDALYPSLYDLFNQRYIPDQVKPGRKLCQIAHGTSVNTVIVHQNFKCILLMDKPTPEDQLDSDNFEEKWPTALLNRFEKHIFILEELVDPETFSLIELTRETLQKGALNPEQYIHNYSKILVESSIARGTKRKKIELTEKDQKQVIEKEISLNLINTAEKEKVHQRSLHMSKLSQSILDLPDTKIQEVISDKLKDLYNSNYIYFLHCQYKGPTQIEKRNQLFEDFIRCQTERSLKKLILDSRREPNPTIDNRCYVAFSLAEPYSTDLRDLVDNDEDLKGHKFNIAIVEYTSYNSLSVKREQIQKIVKDPLHHTIIFQFKHSEEWSNLEEHVSIVSEVLKEITAKKLIILLAHNSSFDENEKKKFKFPSITFHSQFEPISLDILDFKNNDFRAYYELLDKTPFQVLTDPNIGFLEVKLGELLRQEFVYGKPYPQRFSQIDSMVDFIRSKRLMRRIFIHIISQTQEEILLDTQDQSLDVHQPLVDIIRAMGSEVIDIVEMMDKNIIPLVYSVLQCTVRAVHQRCDLFFALRLFAKIEEKKRLSQSTEQLEILMTLWERVALKTSLSLKNRERNCGRIIYTDKDSRENPQIFYLNFLQSIQSLQSELIPLELKQRTVTKFKKRLQMAGCKLLTQELGSTLYKVIKNDVYLYLKDRINLDPSVWTQDIEYLNTEGELSHMVLNGILSSTTSWRRNTYRFNLDDLLMFAEPLVAHFKRENGHLLMQDKVILYCVVLECFPDEIEEYVKLGHEPELALRLIEDMQELKIAKLREANERNSIESLAEQIIGKKIKADREAIGFMAQLLVDDGGSLIKAKFGLAKSTLTQLYTDIFGNQEFKDDLQAKLGVAVNYLDFLIELRFVHHGFSAEEKWKFEGEWLTLMINLMSQANLTVLQKVAIINQEENIYETTMIHCPARILAQLISDADATRLELKDGKLILESPISSFDTSGGITSLHFEDKSRFL